jgi:hypothetical protein
MIETNAYELSVTESESEFPLISLDGISFARVISLAHFSSH